MSEIDTNDCMLWARRLNSQGYGYWTTLIDGKRKRSHRVMYEALVGDIPEGMTIDHLCGYPPCINVDHMEVVTSRENVLRSNGLGAINKRKIMCKNNHPLAGDNLYVYKNMRGCLTCRHRTTNGWDKNHRFYVGGERITV